MEEYYLKPTVQIEPLVWSWYAWTYILSPATAACNIVSRHLKIMQSYINNPKIHIQAMKDPKMVGGPFLDLEDSYMDQVKELFNATKENCRDLIELHDAIKAFDKILQEKAKGYSLEELYTELPDILRGCVELVYDLNNHPSMRLIERFIYQKFYDDSHQEIMLYNHESDFKKFIFSTPSINDGSKLSLKIPFSDGRLDSLFKTRKESCNVSDMAAMLDIPSEDNELFQALFTSEPPKQVNDNNYRGEGVRVRYFGHACVLVETDSTSILIDPAVSYPIENDIPRYTLNDLPDTIDYVVITHGHSDHIMLETLLQLRDRIRHIVFPSNLRGVLQDPSIKLVLEHTGFDSLIEVGELETIPLKDGKIITLPFLGEHCDLNVQSKLAYALNIKGKKIVFAADSNNLDERLYDNIFEFIGEIDILFVGMECVGAPLTWVYGPLLTNPLPRAIDRDRKLSGSDCAKAISIVKKLKCKHAYVYAMGQEPWLSHVMGLNYSPDSLQMTESNKFVDECVAMGVHSERLFGKKEWEFV